MQIRAKGQVMPGLSSNSLRRARHSALLAAGVMLLNACGSTAQWNHTTMSAPGGRSGSESGKFSLPRSSEFSLPRSSRTDLPSSPDAQSAGPQSALGSSGVRNQQGSRVSATDRNPSSATTGSGPGYTKERIYIGYGTWKDADRAYASYGVAGTFGNQEDVAKAIAKDINSRGGIAGREVIPVFYDYQTADILGNPESAAQKACARWTEDQRVFAVQNNIGPVGDRTLIACLAKKGVPLVSGSLGFRTAATYARYSPYVWQPSGVSADRLISRWFIRLKARGYFSGWDISRGESSSVAKLKIGVIARRDVYGREWRELARRELRKIGYSVTDEWEYSGEVSRISTEAQNAVVRFRRSGVTHVISTGSELLAFMQAAASQSYWPRYGLSTNSGPRTVQGTDSTQALEGAMGVGLIPLADVDEQHEPVDASSNTRRCLAVMKRSGLDASSRSSRDSRQLMVAACDGFNFIDHAVELGNLSVRGMHEGAGRLETMSSAMTFRIEFGAGRFDGASAVRDLEYDAACKCFFFASTQNFGM